MAAFTSGNTDEPLTGGLVFSSSHCSWVGKVGLLWLTQEYTFSLFSNTCLRIHL